MPGTAKLEGNPFFQLKFFSVLKTPGEFINAFFKALNPVYHFYP